MLNDQEVVEVKNEIDNLNESIDLVDNNKDQITNDEGLKDVFNTFRLYLMSDKLYEFKCFLNLLYSYFGAMILFWIDVPGYAHSLFIFFNIFFFLRLNLTSFNYLSRLEILNLVLTKWLDTFIVQFIGYCCDSFSTRMIVSSLHLLVTFLLFYFKKESLFYLHVLLHLSFTINNPFFIGLIETIKRLIFTTVLFHFEYVHYLVFFPNYLDRPIFLINAIIPLFKFPNHFALFYFVVFISFRIIILYNERKLVYKVLMKHVSELKVTKESTDEKELEIKSKSIPDKEQLDSMQETRELKESNVSMANNLTNNSLQFFKSTIDGLDKTIVSQSTELFTKASNALQPPFNIFQNKKKTSTYDFINNNEIYLNQGKHKSNINNFNLNQETNVNDEEKNSFIKPINLRKIYSSN